VRRGISARGPRSAARMRRTKVKELIESSGGSNSNMDVKRDDGTFEREWIKAGKSGRVSSS